MPKTLIILCCFPHSREIFPSDPLYNKYYTKQESEFSLDVFHRIGLNTGNYFFNEALVRHMGIDNCLFLIESEIVKEESRATVEALLDQADTIVYPMANLIRGDEMPFHKKALRNLLTYTKKPIHLIGLGAQLNQEDRPNEDILNLIGEITQRVRSIGVRGAFTSDVLSSFGIKNSEVIGCPSAFYRMSPTFDRIQIDPHKKLERIAANGELDATGLNFSLYTARDSRTCLFLQNEPLVFYDYNLLSSGWKQISINNSKLGNFTQEEISLFDNYIRNKGMWFDGMYDWLWEISKFNFSIGPRFHGNMAALQAGVPALWIAHDCRTRELINHFALPHITYKDVEGKTLDELYCYTDYDKFYNIYPHLYKKYKNFLRDNNINNVLPESEELAITELSEIRKSDHSEYIALNKIVDDKNKKLELTFLDYKSKIKSTPSVIVVNALTRILASLFPSKRIRRKIRKSLFIE